jgi:predicted transcriptional regulator of viral defense system
MPIMPGRVYSQLLEFAIDQYGYVTTDDARELGISPRRLKLLAERDTLWRVARGLYRFPAEVVPVTALDQYMEATLLPGTTRGVLSHQTALAVYELSDVNPLQVHITVPRSYRTRRELPAVYRIHRGTLADEDVTYHEAIPIVTPAHAIRQSCYESHLGNSLIGQAIDHGETKGELTLKQAAQLREEIGVPAGSGMRR